MEMTWQGITPRGGVRPASLLTIGWTCDVLRRLAGNLDAFAVCA
jgi:hypothetical protein